MVFTIIALAVAGAAVLVAAVVLFRHWREIRLLDPLSIKEEAERQQREALIERRFERVSADKLQPFKRLFRQFGQNINHAYRNACQRLQDFEAHYRQGKNPSVSVEPTAKERLQSLATEARSLARDLKWAEAERQWLQALALDHRFADAYRGLAFIYLKQQQLPQAKETLEFIIKMKKADDGTYAGLAEIAEAENRLNEAETMRLKAVELGQRQAQRHAELAAFYVSRKQPAKAWPSAKRASDLEPKSVKYLETSLEIAILLGDRIEARRRLERLRMLTDDTAKIQGWQEKMDAR